MGSVAVRQHIILTTIIPVCIANCNIRVAENFGHENDGYEIAGHENAGHEHNVKVHAIKLSQKRQTFEAE